MKLREAVIQDVEKLVDLVNSAYRGDFSKKGWTTEAELLGGQRIDRQSVIDQMKLKDSVILVYEQEPKILACVFLSKKDSRTAYLGMFTVHPELQGQGLGKHVLSTAEDFCRREWGIQVVEMTVIRQRPELIAWYERRGYERTGRTEDFPYGDERFGIPKRDELVMEVLTKMLSAF
ncbi:MAG: GNAT family N-acetyltransferase [Pseudobdellovibrionaceae bacterium]